MLFTVVVSLVSFALSALGAQMTVAVGKDGLVFTPNSVTAAAGDTYVVFYVLMA